MTETCFVTQVRLLAALDAANAAAAQQVKKPTPATRASSFFASIPWPFLPQVTCPANTLAPSTKMMKEPLNLTGGILRQRRPTSTVTAVLAPLQQLHLKVQQDSSMASLPALVLLLLKGLHSHLAKGALGAAVASALVLLVAEGVACVASVVAASRLPAGLFFMVAALALMGFVAGQAILHDSASIQRRRSSRALLHR